MPKDTDDCEVMNELFGNDEQLPPYHWHPVAIVYPNGEKIRDLTREEQLQWLKQQKEKER